MRDANFLPTTRFLLLLSKHSSISLATAEEERSLPSITPMFPYR